MQPNEEQRLVIKDETFNDTAVRALAIQHAKAVCAKQFGRLKKQDYYKSVAFQQYNNCYNALSDYDKLRVDDLVHEYYCQYSLFPERFMNYAGFKSEMKKVVLIVIAIFCIFLLPMVCLYYAAEDTPPVNIEQAIEFVFEFTQEHVYDYNKDYKINCIDYATLFKNWWDVSYPNLKSRCIIIHNYNPPRMNHLFIGVYDNQGKLLLVEPYSQWGHWEFEENWTNGKYNPRFNRYNETLKWLSTERF